MTNRLFIAAALIACMYAGTEYFRAFGLPTETKTPEPPLSNMPSMLGNWQNSTEHAVAAELEGVSGAAMETVRAYRDPAGHLISLYAGAFEKYGYRILHPPELCYGGTGWRVTSAEPLVLPDGGGASTLTRFETMQHGGQEIYLLYWYQIKDMTFYDGDGQRRAVWKLRGRKTWPPMVKVMLQTSAADADQAKELLKSLAVPAKAWVDQIH
jgi:EpsI family protein